MEVREFSFEALNDFQSFLIDKGSFLVELIKNYKLFNVIGIFFTNLFGRFFI